MRYARALMTLPIIVAAFFALYQGWTWVNFRETNPETGPWIGDPGAYITIGIVAGSVSISFSNMFTHMNSRIRRLEEEVRQLQKEASLAA